jgi:hypothetical protein
MQAMAVSPGLTSAAIAYCAAAFGAQWLPLLVIRSNHERATNSAALWQRQRAAGIANICTI